MFTWLQIHTQRHHKKIFGLLLVVIIIAFVFTIGNFGGFGGSNAPGNTRRDFYGFNLNSSRDMSLLQDWTVISFALDRRRISEDQLSAGMMQRAVMLSLAAQLQIPEPTEAQFSQYVAQRPVFINPMTGQFSQDQYTSFVDSFKTNPSMNEDTLTTALVQDYRIQQVRQALGGPGYVLPYMATEEIKRRDTTWSVDVATLERDTYQPEIAITDEALKDYYDQNQFRYETEPGYVTEYVDFPSKDFLDQVPNPDEAAVSAYYNANKAQWPKNDAGAAKPLTEIREQVVAAWKQERAQQLAVDAANQFAVELYDVVYAGKVKGDDDSLVAFLEPLGLDLQSLPAFTASTVPTDAPLPASALQQAFSLDTERFYSDALPTDDGAAILVLKAITPSTVPPLDEVRAAVVADYTRDETARQFNLHGQELQKQLQAAVDEDAPFVKTAEGFGLTVKSFPDFTFANPPQGLDNYILYTIMDMSQGEVSNLVGFGDVGTMIYIAKKDIPAISATAPEVQEEMKTLGQFTARATESAIVSELILVGQEKANPEPQAL